MAAGAIRKVVLKALGLKLYSNELDNPLGSMDTASNVFIDRPGVIESQRALRTLYNSTTPAAGTTWGYLQPLTSNGSTNTYAQAVGAGGFPTYDNWRLNDNLRLFAKTNAAVTSTSNFIPYTSFRANGNDYLCGGGSLASANFGKGIGPVRVDTSGGALYARPYGVGMPDGLECLNYTGAATTTFAGLTVPVTAAGTVLNALSGAKTPAIVGGQVAYRVLYLTKDAGNNLVRGAPSGRTIVYYTSATTYGLFVFLPAGQTYAGDIVQLYRSETVTAAATSQPSDDCRLVYEYIVQSGDVTAGFFTIQDVVPDDLRGAALYTNATQDGILAAETRPPVCSYAAYFKNVAWYSGVNDKGYQATLTILGVSAWATGGGSETNFILGGVTYKATTAEDLPNHKFLKATAGSASQNNAMTAQSLCRAINYNNATYKASYLSGPTDTQTVIGLKAYPTLSAPIYTAPSLTTSIAPAAGSVAPNLPITFTTSAKPNWLFFSKENQPEAVPDLNYAACGSPDTFITGMAALRDSLFVFSTTGLYRVTGTSPADVRVEMFDETIRQQVGQSFSIASAGNMVFAMCNQGLVTVTESGVTIISQPIFSLVQEAAGDIWNASDVAPPVIGAASSVEQKYMCILNSQDTSGLGTQQFLIYNYITGAWTTRAAVSSSQFRWVTAGQVAVSAPAGVTTDAFLISKTSNAAGTDLNLYAMWQKPDTGVVYLDNASFSYAIEDAENPGQLKRFYSIAMPLNGTTVLTQLTATFTSDASSTPVAVTPTISADKASILFQVPREHSQCSRLGVAFSYSDATAGVKLVCLGAILSMDDLGDRLPGARG